MKSQMKINEKKPQTHATNPDYVKTLVQFIYFV